MKLMVTLLALLFACLWCGSALVLAAMTPRVHFTAPSFDDARRSCADSSVLIPQTGPLKIVLRWRGPAWWSDTVSTSYGASGQLDPKWAPGGVYKLFVWAVDPSGNASCQDSLVVKLAKDPPAKPATQVGP